VYNLGAQLVLPEFDVIFDSNGVSTAGVTHVPGTSQIVVSAAGDYKVSFSVSAVEPNQFALFLNNATVVPGTVYGTGSSTEQNGGQAIVTLAAGSILTLRNHTSSAGAVSLQTSAGGTQPNVNASIVIEKLG
jgi:hypothetical protein